ncbi:hypothetical protein RIF29_15358 [Crotalaria pallida]|uniref:Uncharacterized protein n=1 Tax=Crotalaria pallida TaxID=3830 RepID=A0AAN9FIY9_CROPI
MDHMHISSPMKKNFNQLGPGKYRLIRTKIQQCNDSLKHNCMSSARQTSIDSGDLQGGPRHSISNFSPFLAENVSLLPSRCEGSSNATFDTDVSQPKGNMLNSNHTTYKGCFPHRTTSSSKIITLTPGKRTITGGECHVSIITSNISSKCHKSTLASTVMDYRSSSRKRIHSVFANDMNSCIRKLAQHFDNAASSGSGAGAPFSDFQSKLCSPKNHTEPSIPIVSQRNPSENHDFSLMENGLGKFEYGSCSHGQYNQQVNDIYHNINMSDSDDDDNHDHDEDKYEFDLFEDDDDDLLGEIEKQLRILGKPLTDFPNMPVSNMEEQNSMNNPLIVEQLNFNKNILAQEFQELNQTMTDEQKEIFNKIISAVEEKEVFSMHI